MAVAATALHPFAPVVAVVEESVAAAAPEQLNIILAMNVFHS